MIHHNTFMRAASPRILGLFNPYCSGSTKYSREFLALINIHFVYKHV